MTQLEKLLGRRAKLENRLAGLREQLLQIDEEIRKEQSNPTPPPAKMKDIMVRAAERRARMCQMRREGKTYREIGAAFGVSANYARTLVKQYIRREEASKG